MAKASSSLSEGFYHFTCPMEGDMADENQDQVKNLTVSVEQAQGSKETLE